MLIEFALLLSCFLFAQDVPGDVTELASTLRHHSEIRKISSVSRYTYIVDRKNKAPRTFYSYFKFEMVDPLQFVYQTTDYVDENVPLPESYEFTVMFNPNYVAGVRNHGEGEYSMTDLNEGNTDPSSQNYIALMFFPINSSTSFVDHFQAPNTNVNSFKIDENGNAVVEMSAADESWELLFDLDRGVCTSQVHLAPNGLVKQVRIEFDQPNETFPKLVEVLATNAMGSVTTRHDYLEFEEDISISAEKTYLTFYGLPEPNFGTEPKSLWTRGLGVFGIIACALGLVYLFRRNSKA